MLMLVKVCGIVVTQYHPEKGIMYPMSTYILLLFQNAVSAGAGVYNQYLAKSSHASMHAMNMALYSAGIGANILVHLVVRITNPDEPSFYAGLGSWTAVVVIICNIFVGIIMTAVYKCMQQSIPLCCLTDLE